MKRWRAVLLDLDDTLYPEAEFVRSGFRAVAEWAASRFGGTAAEVFRELDGLFRAGVRGDTFDRWLAARGLDPGPWVAQMVRVYREHEPRIAPDPSAAKVLEALRRECRIGLVSDGSLVVQQRKLAALGLERHFDAVVFSDVWGRGEWKPSPRPYREALERLDVPAEHAVYVGDNPEKDFLGARRAGMASVRLRRPGGLHADLEPEGPGHAPDAEIGALEELPRILEALARERGGVP